MVQDTMEDHYSVLGLSRTAGTEEIRTAYRRLAKQWHPDRNSTTISAATARFQRIQAAYEVLCEPLARAAYDDALVAGALRFRGPSTAAAARHDPAAAAAGPPPGVAEALLLQQLLDRTRVHPGGVYDPSCQLCVTCEVCRRPATQACWTCGMDICDFCTRRQHWKGAVRLHWPLVNRPGSMLEQLGKRELALKREHDGQAYLQAQPGFRPQAERQTLHAFQDALVEVLRSLQVAAAAPPNTAATRSQRRATAAAPRQPSAFALAAPGSIVSGSSGGLSGSVAPHSSSAIVPSGSGGALAVAAHTPSDSRCHQAWLAAGEGPRLALLAHHDQRLARFYRWCQTDCLVLLAVYLPTGGGKAPPQLQLECTATTLRVQHDRFGPVLSRAWAHPIDASVGVSSWVSGDGRLLLLQAAKAAPGQPWGACFRGDPHAARCLTPPYSLVQTRHEVQLELPLPFWVDAREDVAVECGPHGLQLSVEGLLVLHRTYFRSAAAPVSPAGGAVVDVAASSWCVLDGPPGRSSSSSQAAGGAASGRRRPGKLLSVSMALPPASAEEVQYKKGVRQDNAAAVRSCPNGAGQRGHAFFVEDEDEWGLDALLQALQFHASGRAWLLPRPWEVTSGIASSSSSAGGGSWRAVGDCSGQQPDSPAAAARWATEEAALPADVRQHLAWLRRMGAQQEEGAAARGGTGAAAAAAGGGDGL